MKNSKIILWFFLISSLNAQIYYKSWFIDDTTSVVYIKQKDLSICKGYNQYNLTFLGDSIETYAWQNYYWFNAFFKSGECGNYSQLFAYNSDKKEIIKVTNYKLGYSSGTLTEDIKFVNNNLIVCTFNCNDDPIGHPEWLIIDGKELIVKKIVKFHNSTRINKVYTKWDNIFVELQPYDRELDWAWILTFWFPRGVPSKWKYYPNGNTWLYVLDNKFNIVNKYGDWD